MKRVAVFLSGRGSNMVALVRACKEGRAEAEVALVVSNDKKAPGLEKAKTWGSPRKSLPGRISPPKPNKNTVW
jgi:phosphoribosylglycinamide formyltransferase-1